MQQVLQSISGNMTISRVPSSGLGSARFLRRRAMSAYGAQRSGKAAPTQAGLETIVSTFRVGEATTPICDTGRPSRWCSIRMQVRQAYLPEAFSVVASILLRRGTLKMSIESRGILSCR